MVKCKPTVLFCVLIYLTHCAFGQKCNRVSLRRFDSSFAKLLTLGGSGRSFPEDKHGQLKKYCDDSFNYIQDIDKYKNKCMEQMPKQVTGVIVHSVKKVINKYCKRDSKALTDLISSTPCANRAKRDVDQCYTALVDKFHGAYNAVDKLRIPHICCDYFNFFECVQDKSENYDICDEFKLETVTNFVREIFGNVVDMLCGDYVEGSDKCQKLGSAPKKLKSQRRAKSFMMPLIDALTSIPEQ